MHNKKLSLLSVGKFVFLLRYNLMNVLDETKQRQKDGRRTEYGEEISTNDNNVKAGAKLYVSFI